MARRYEQITELYRQSIREITSRPENWTSFLRSACRNYRLPFDELVLIYAQRPDATAVLPAPSLFGRCSRDRKRT